MAMSMSPSTSGPVVGLETISSEMPAFSDAEIAQDGNGEPMRERRRQRDLEHPLRPPLLLDHLAQRLVDPVERFRHDRQDVAPGLGEHELLRATFEQSDAEKVLEHDHVTAHRALRDRQAIGGGGEAQMLPGRLERPKRVERQPFAIHSSSERGAFISFEWARARQS